MAQGGGGGGGGSAIAIVLGKLAVLVRLTNLDNSRTRAYCACISIFFLLLSGRRPDID